MGTVSQIYSARKPLTLWGMVVVDPRYPSLSGATWKWRGLDHVSETTWNVRGPLLRVDTTYIAHILLAVYSACGSNQSTLQHYDNSHRHYGRCVYNAVQFNAELSTKSNGTHKKISVYHSGQRCGSKQEHPLRLLAALDSWQGQLRA